MKYKQLESLTNTQLSYLDQTGKSVNALICFYTHTHARARARTHTHTHTHTHTYTHTHICLHTHTHMHTRARMCARLFI